MTVRCCLYVMTLPLLIAGATLQAEETAAPEKVSYYRDVRPLFQSQCQGCHQPAKASGQYVMTDFAAMLKGGESEEPAIIPGKSAGSYLMDQIETVGGKAAMPRGKPALSDEQVEMIRRWIDQGAKDDTPASARSKFDMAPPPTYEAAPVITSLDFSPDGKLLAVSGYHEVLLHDMAQETPAQGARQPVARLVGLSERIESARFSPDGKRLAVTGGSPGRMGEVQAWDVEKKKLTLSVPVTFDTLYGGSWSPDGKLIAFGCSDNTLRAIDSTSGKQVLFNGAHADWVLDTVFATDGSHVVSVSRDRSMKLVEVATQRFIDNITSITPGALKGGLAAIDRHPTKEELLIGGADGVAKVYKMHRTTKRKIGDDDNRLRVFADMPGRIFAVAYSPRGERAAVGSSLDGRGHVWVFNAEDGKVISKISDTDGGIYAVCWRPDGKAIAWSGFDGQVRLSNPANGELLESFIPVPLPDNAVAATGR